MKDLIKEPPVSMRRVRRIRWLNRRKLSYYISTAFNLYEDSTTQGYFQIKMMGKKQLLTNIES